LEIDYKSVLQLEKQLIDFIIQFFNRGIVSFDDCLMDIFNNISIKVVNIYPLTFISSICLNNYILNENLDIK